jgi:glycosyltransferase involved in cell wall biosynthesis
MRVLVLHSRYLSGVASGENRVVEDEIRLLRSAGHEVEAWQPSVEPSTSGLQMAADAVWSRSSARALRRLLDGREPEVVHVHSLYPRLSPSILRAVPRQIPVVMTLHDFRLMCLPATYLRESSICEDCAGRLPWRGVVHACYRSSRPASAALAASVAVHRWLDTFSRVALFLAVSRFVRDKHVQAGMEPGRLRIKGNFAWPTKRRDGAGGPVVFLGRLSAEKGIEPILRALPGGLDLVIAGDGPQRRRLEQQAGKAVTLLGQIEPGEVAGFLRSARALVVPSLCYEGQPRVILEAFAAGVPVLASRIGGLPELVDHGVNGYLVEPGIESAWHDALERISDDSQSRRLGSAAYLTWRQRFTPDSAIRELEAVYGEVAAGVPSGR